MKRILFPVCVLAAAACGNKSAAKLREVAARANPVLIELRKQTAVILSADSTPAQVIPACEAGMSIAAHLTGLDFKDEHLGSNGALSIEDVLYGFKLEQATKCTSDSEDAARESRCASWCRERFGQLAEAVDRVRAEGSKEGISFEVLR